MNADLMGTHADQCYSVWRFSDIPAGGVSRGLAHAVSMLQGSKSGGKAEGEWQEKSRNFFGCGFGGFGVRGLICSVEVQKHLLPGCFIISGAVSQNTQIGKGFAKDFGKGIVMGKAKTTTQRKK